MPAKKKQSSEAAVREIRRRARRRFSAEEKIRIVLEGLRGEVSPGRDLHSPAFRHRVAVTSKIWLMQGSISRQLQSGPEKVME